MFGIEGKNRENKVLYPFLFGRVFLLVAFLVSVDQTVSREYLSSDEARVLRNVRINLECPNGMCILKQNPQLNPGNEDIPTYDLISSFHLEQAELRYPGVAIIPGSLPTQRAYRLEEDSDLVASTFEVFPHGIPTQFSFQTTFRSREQQALPWYLLHVTNASDQSQLSVELIASQQLVGVGLPDINGNVQKVYFRDARLFDRSWHKIMLSVANDQATMWIDCRPVPGIRGGYFEQLLPRREFDTSGGHVYISRSQNELAESTALVSFPLCLLFRGHKTFKWRRFFLDRLAMDGAELRREAPERPKV